jgi:signal transduction histidine kinase
MTSDPSAELEATRRRILSWALKASGATAALLFELTETDANYRIEAHSQPEPGSGRGLSSNGLLAKWLRINNEVLPVPDSVGIFEELSADERVTLQELSISACMPLVHERALVGIVGVVSGAGNPRLAELRESAAERRTWAAHLNESQSTRRARVLAETTARSNRLSVTGQLAASIAHEVRNPLAAIRSTVQLIRDNEVPPEDHGEFLGNVIEEVDRVSLVVTQLLSAGRLRSPNYQSFELVDVIDDAIRFLRGYTKPQEQSIERTGLASAVVHGDPYELRQVLVNLLLNACQASPAGGCIRVDCASDADHSCHVVRVSDEGVGIPNERLSQVFEPFYTTKVDGGGLGLGICRETIERHGGRVELASQLGLGTTITFHLPAGSTDATHSRR